MRAGIYCRISKDADGRQTSTARQEADCRAYALAKGWEVAEVFVDIDTSAYRRGVHRPAYDEMLAAARYRQLDVVLVWKLDRLVRRSIELERCWQILQEHDVELAAVHDSIDTSSPNGMAVVRIISALAQAESETSSLRIRSAVKHRALAGERPATGRRAYGLTADWSQVVPEEAERVMEASLRVLAGDSIRTIVLDWNRQGVPTVTGARWLACTVSRMLRQPRIAGLRRIDGKLIEGKWPAIVPELTWRRVCAVLDAPGRRAPAVGSEWLLTGLARCSLCGTTLKGSLSLGGRYYCPPKPDGCGSVTVKREKLDAYVVGAVLATLDPHRLADRRQRGRTDDAPVVREIEQAEQTLADLAGMLGRGEIGRTEWAVARDAANNRLSVASARLAARQPERSALPDGGVTAESWAAMEFERRRALLRSVIDSMRISPVGRSKWVPIESRVLLEWRS